MLTIAKLNNYLVKPHTNQEQVLSMIWYMYNAHTSNSEISM